ncbi:RrF2 family transcriptional regulator [Entomobacter blattae]|uniref:HTH-type transcriptional repressor NsrR n=1 Tax=Entomobacter blattae TaxID=2762277 RepID=A0A7H1NTX4_9PROT|nr:Rrf2 family transcriptional regulator [Entomobacter blattae]QNT79234.1 HTH-type transcriptional repressor NsrR [Entomobacter blattae]
MAYISNAVEYGLHCLLYLSESPTGREGYTVRSLAAFQGVPKDYLAKIFTKLHKAGLVIATEGVTGGFVLARPAEEISVLDVIEAIDAHKPFFECRDIREKCALFEEGASPQWATDGVCAIHAVMLEVEKKMKQELDRYTLSSLKKAFVKKAPDEFLDQMDKWFHMFSPQGKMR